MSDARGSAPGNKLRLMLDCAALQGLRDDMPTLIQNVLRMRCLWLENRVLMSRFVQGAMRCSLTTW